MIPVILSGGSGSRLWPVSRGSFPKQFCDLLDESLFEKTVRRLKPLGQPWVVTTREMKTLTERALKEMQMPTANAIYEPFGRNTAPAVALVCKRMLLEQKGDEVVGIFPADQLIDDEGAFQDVVRKGSQIAKSDQVVTLGIRPSYPATGYGYIETSGPSTKTESQSLLAVGFREKPNAETAREFLARGGFYWNAGMFIFRVNHMVNLFQQYAPDVWHAIDELSPDLSNFVEVYSRVRSVSIDYAIMERLPSHVSIPCHFSWNDLGSWDSMAEVIGVGADDKHKIEIESDRNFVFPFADKTYGFVGVNDLIVVDTADATLIARRGQTELVKQLVDQMKAAGNSRITDHRFEIRPWGRFEILADARNYKAKAIEVDPGAQISHQSHSKRTETWVFIAGEGEVIIGDQMFDAKAGVQLSASAGIKHRIRNTSSSSVLKFIEVQTGTYFGEDDIVRHADDYNRQ